MEDNKNYTLGENIISSKTSGLKTLYDKALMLLLVLGVFMLPVFSGYFMISNASDLSAATTTPPTIGCDESVLGCGEYAAENIEEHWIITKGIPNWIEWMILFAAGGAVVVIMIGGIMFLTAVGNDEMITRAKTTITWAIVGLLIAMFSYGIVKLIENIAFTKS